MTKYLIIKRKTDDGWEVWWDGKRVYQNHNPITAEWGAGDFATGLEMGITGSKEPLYANSQIKIEGWYNYLEAFDTYEEYHD